MPTLYMQEGGVETCSVSEHQEPYTNPKQQTRKYTAEYTWQLRRLALSKALFGQPLYGLMSLTRLFD